MHGQPNVKYTEMHGQQNVKYSEMHGQQNGNSKWFFTPIQNIKYTAGKIRT